MTEASFLPKEATVAESPNRTSNLEPTITRQKPWQNMIFNLYDLLTYRSNCVNLRCNFVTNCLPYGSLLVCFKSSHNVVGILSHIEVIMELWAPPQTWMVLLRITTPALSVPEFGDSCLLHLLKALLTSVYIKRSLPVEPLRCLFLFP